MIVVDASVVIEVLMHSRAGDAIAERIFSASETLHAPELLDVEVVQVARRLEALGDLGGRRAWELPLVLADLRIERYPHRTLLPRIWQLRHNVTAYDASYVALAEALQAPLLTRDRRLARAPHDAEVEVI